MEINCGSMLNGLNLLFIIGFGIITTFEDLKYGKIKNKYILLAILFTSITYTTYFSFGETGYNFFLSSLTNATVAMLVGLALWSFNAITAGDAKLFFAYSLLLPLSVYRLGYINYFPSFTILLNTFITVFAYLFAKLMLMTDKEEKLQILKETFTLKNIATMSLFFFGFTWMIQALFLQMGIKLSFVFQLFFLLSALFLIRKYLKSHFLNIIIATSILRVVFDYASIITAKFWLNFIPLIAVFLFLMGFVFNLGEFMFNQKVGIHDLKEGMMPIEAVIKKGKKYVKTSISQNIFSSKQFLIDYKPSGLTRRDIETLKKLSRNGKLAFDSLVIQQTMPFALLLFIGVLLTLISQGSFIEFLKMDVLTKVLGYTVIFK